MAEVMQHLSTLVGEFRDARILVFGDLMLDRFIYGEAQRISPEAPVPVVSVSHESVMLGGAGNVARNIASLGGRAVLIGLVGDDVAGAEFCARLKQESGIVDAVVVAKGRPTTEKIRYIAGRQQLLRADREDRRPAAEDALLATFLQHLASVDAVILSDYAKGVLTDTVLSAAIRSAREAGKPVIVDPKSAELGRYDGATLLTPNRNEATLATGISGEDDAETVRAAEAILKDVPNTGAVLVTRGPLGMTLLVRGARPVNIASAAQEVFDVSGAGDTAVATLALTLGSKRDLLAGAEMANVAAGIAVAKVGTVAVRAEELMAALVSGDIQAREGKVRNRQTLMDDVARLKAQGMRIGFTNGCFDFIHPGHVSLLAQARAACDVLIVGLNTDASVRQLKGPTRPVQDEGARAIVLASLRSVDIVCLFDEETPLELIKAIKPDLLVKGADYRVDQVVGADVVQAQGGRVLLVDLVAGQGTTAMIARAKQPSL